MRLTKEELNALKTKYGVNELWSFSKVHTYITSPFCYYLKYIKHEKETDATGIYSESGSSVHDIMEKFYNNEISYEEMISKYEDSLVVFNMAELKYNKSDEEKNAKIANKYENDIRHFLTHHQKIQGLTKTEEFVVTKVGPYVFQGYADMIGKQNDQWTIYDFKTSTIYTGEKVKTEAAQLLLYVQSLMQHGVALDNIKCCWDFCKYTNVEYAQKNGKIKQRSIERGELGSSLASSVKTKLKDAGCSQDQIELLINQLILTNDIKCLPQEVQDQYTFSDCLVYVPLSQDLIDNFNSELIDTLKEIETKTKLTNSLTNDKEIEEIWWDSDELLKKNSYFHCNLSGFKPEQHKPWKQYIEKLEAEKNALNNMFFSNTTESNDLSWLNDF